MPSLILVVACIYFGIAVNAMLIEPTRLVVREITITTPKITQPITIVFCADMQTEHVGSYERWVLQKIKEQNADLILFGGDYLQIKTLTETDEEEERLVKEWNQLFREIDLQAPLGIYAVQGNQEHWWRWQEMFADTAIVPKEWTVTQQIGEIRVTFLSLGMSGAERSVPDNGRGDKFRIIVGHMPDFAMAEQEADLLLAGHTHGGQIQIPFFGPVVTGSRDLPRRWASGVTLMPNGAKLIVTHGTGPGQGSRTRVRFWCRPDIWVIRLVPD